MDPSTRLPEGSVTSPRGFQAAAAAAGLKTDGTPDVALLASVTPCSAAGVFSQNRVRGAPVLYDEAVLAERPGRLRGVVVNSGVANAATGAAGLRAAEAMGQAAERALDVPSRSVLVLSTGRIGEPLPEAPVAAAIQEAAARLADDGGVALARAMLMTDRSPKHLAVQIETPSGAITLGGVAKGSRMVHPQLATVLGILTTDAAVEAAQLGDLLRRITDRTFNAITIDGTTSPNDAVLLLANGASEIPVARDAETWRRFQEAAEQVARELALMVVRDEDAGTRFVELTVTGAATETVARSVGRAVGANALVREALGAGRPDWGRVLVAVGGCGVPIEPDRVQLSARPWGDADAPWLTLAEGGEAAGADPAEADRVFGETALALRLELHTGGAEATVWISP